MGLMRSRAVTHPVVDDDLLVGKSRSLHHLSPFRKQANLKARTIAANPFEPLADDTIQRLLGDLEAARNTFAESVGRYRGTRLTSQAALATEAQDYRGGEAVALGLADATGHAVEAFDSFVRAIKPKK